MAAGTVRERLRFWKVLVFRGLRNEGFRVYGLGMIQLIRTDTRNSI